MGVEAFKANVKGGYRPNKFKVIIPILGEKLEFVCKAAQLPGRTMGLVETQYQGRTVKFKGDPTFEEVTLTILLDTDFKVYNEIDAWMIAMDNVAGETGGILDVLDYKVDGDILALDNNGDTIQSYKWIGMFPTALQPLDVDWSTVDTLAEYTVTFAYDYHIPTAVALVF